MRVGMGYDVHKLTEGRKLILGGVDIPWEKGLLGHSDADVIQCHEEKKNLYLWKRERYVCMCADQQCTI